MDTAPERPPVDESLADTCRVFSELGVATVYEASGRRGLIDIPLIPLLAGKRVAGPALTVLCGQGDNLMVHAAMERVFPGCVLVITMPEPEPVALVGELLAIQAQVRGAAALLVDAAVRDVDELRAMGLPIWTRFIRVRGATKERPGGIDVPVVVGGTRIEPGDLVILDDDGGVVVTRTDIPTVLEKARARAERETRLRRELLAGALTYDVHGLRRLVEGQEGP
ncbi:MAG: 4-carboxy-4-hydroxy-2-oxoadipate aldolase/oxaloacetate decarboxylase [Thermomicrobium sp.]|nr:4-carboxy-4-hydroxy-2-oxoadipate aldolase/oxaloacetate decarboxylase [Thermomicrobium sp.]MCS7246379.1 4-carboxy-4-hydroxy-2-oxoadipate aldolase/oxaloacetate decarboxylase [Thermomicrobium sp.]MDW7982370.1 4-carboxy-4-hydroxy-2-oxoadipate aldolase/oxaloacetate decarboxylase [Thermomicrobium sp.]